MFTDKFNKYVVDGDTITVIKKGLVYTAKVVLDHYDIDEDDSHNPDQSVTGCNDEQQERLLKARRAFFAGEWFYCGIVISVSTDTGFLLDDHAASLWGIEANYPDSDNEYLLEVANELFDDATSQAEKRIREWSEFASKYLA